MFKAVTEPPASFNPLKFSSMKMLISSIAFYIIPPTDPLIPFILSLWVYFILNYYITGVSEMNFRQIHIPRVLFCIWGPTNSRLLVCYWVMNCVPSPLLSYGSVFTFTYLRICFYFCENKNLYFLQFIICIFSLYLSPRNIFIVTIPIKL